MGLGDRPVQPSYKCPEFGPYTDEEKFKGVWIEIKAKEVLWQTALEGDNSGGLVLGADGPEWKYLAPQQIMETVNNTWEPWETISSRMAGKGKEFIQLSEEFYSLVNAVEQSNWGTSVGKAFKALSSVKKAAFKIDTPLVYENTDRREWTMQFNLVSSNDSEAKKMMSGIIDLRDSSMPARDGESDFGLGITLPYVFSVSSQPGRYLISSNDYCAITSVQPTYMAPYDSKGRPMRVELTVTFKEISPLYAPSRTEVD